MTADEAITYVRLQSQVAETINYLYVLDENQRLLGVLWLRELFNSPKDTLVHEVMRPDVVTVPDRMDQEAVAQIFARSDLIALPVVDAENRMKGIIRIDDGGCRQRRSIGGYQKFGGMQALHAPYLDVGFWSMLRKHAGWLALSSSERCSRRQRWVGIRATLPKLSWLRYSFRSSSAEETQGRKPPHW
jgi:magnesium transporter